jgi:hypothetical protein
MSKQKSCFDRSAHRICQYRNEEAQAEMRMRFQTGKKCLIPMGTDWLLQELSNVSVVGGSRCPFQHKNLALVMQA